MPKSIFDRVMGWPYHPQAIMALSFSGCFIVMIQGDNPAWAALVVAAIAAPLAALLLLLPYLCAVILLAAVLSLLSLTHTIQANHHKSNPASR